MIQWQLNRTKSVDNRIKKREGSGISKPGEVDVFVINLKGGPLSRITKKFNFHKQLIFKITSTPCPRQHHHHLKSIL